MGAIMEGGGKLIANYLIAEAFSEGVSFVVYSAYKLHDGKPVTEMLGFAVDEKDGINKLCEWFRVDMVVTDSTDGTPG